MAMDGCGKSFGNMSIHISNRPCKIMRHEKTDHWHIVPYKPQLPLDVMFFVCACLKFVLTMNFKRKSLVV